MALGDIMNDADNTRSKYVSAMVVLLAYALSLYIVLVQLIWIYSDLFYGSLLLVHSVIYFVMTFRAERLNRWRWLSSIVLGGVIIGTMPYVGLFAELSALFRGERFEPSNVTRGLPTILQVIIELGFIPSVQACLAWVVMRFGPPKSPSESQ